MITLFFKKKKEKNEKKIRIFSLYRRFSPFYFRYVLDFMQNMMYILCVIFPKININRSLNS